MNPETRIALRGSIKKWEKVVERKGVDRKNENCPLCQTCSCLVGSEILDRCPVYMKTNKPQCWGTPYKEWTDHQCAVHPNEKIFQVFENCPDCKRLAQAELDFLKSLLPKEKP